MYWSFADMNVGNLIPIDAIVKFVFAPDLHIPLVFAHYGLEHPEWMTLSALLSDPLSEVYMWICWLLTVLNNTCPIKLSSLFVSSVMSCLFYLRLRLRWTFYEFGESSPQLLCIALKVHYRLRLRLWVVSPGHYWLWLPRIYHGEVTQPDSNLESSTASLSAAETIKAYDASSKHSRNNSFTQSGRILTLITRSIWSERSCFASIEYCIELVDDITYLI